jgi:hypothetical protein
MSGFETPGVYKRATRVGQSGPLRLDDRLVFQQNGHAVTNRIHAMAARAGESFFFRIQYKRALADRANQIFDVEA